MALSLSPQAMILARRWLIILFLVGLLAIILVVLAWWSATAGPVTVYRVIRYGDTTIDGGILKKCVNSQAVYPLSEQHGLEARERRYTAHEEGKHWE